jgi:hypothetical protein
MVDTAVIYYVFVNISHIHGLHFVVDRRIGLSFGLVKICLLFADNIIISWASSYIVAEIESVLKWWSSESLLLGGSCFLIIRLLVAFRANILQVARAGVVYQRIA